MSNFDEFQEPKLKWWQKVAKIIVGKVVLPRPGK